MPTEIIYNNQVLSILKDSGEYITLHTTGQILEGDITITILPEDWVAPGLYNIATNELVASWEQLINYYGIDIEKDYDVDYSSGDYEEGHPTPILQELSIIRDYPGAPIKDTLSFKLVIDRSITKIGQQAFMDCDVLEEVILPNSIVNIGLGAFRRSNNLKKINITKNMTHINDVVFEGCNLDEIVIPDNIISIGDNAFIYCYLNNISLSNNLIFIGEYAFYGIPTSNYNVYENSNYLGNETNPYIALIEVNSNASSPTIHSNTKVIGCRAFNSNTNLESIALPEGLVGISKAVFEGCSNLISILLPTTIRYIGEVAFGVCENLTNINYNGTIEQWNAIEKHENWNAASSITTITCSDGTITL